VSAAGSDKNDGTIDKPLATVAMALRKAREIRRLNDTALYPETPFRGSIKNPIEIIIGDGVYKFSEALFIRPEDSGTEESPTIIKTATGARPIFSGGVEITGWKKLQSEIVGLPSAAHGKVWVANLPTTDLNIIRQLWVNDKKAIRAKDRNGDSMSRILSWDKASQTCWIPKPKTPGITNVKGMEMFIHQWWAIAILRIKSVKLVGDSMQLQFQQPESRIQSEHPWPAPWISQKTGNSAFYLMNAIQFLDEPGEWYIDQQSRKIYYYPRKNENMSTAKVFAPLLENIVKMEGTIDRPVSHIQFKGISFQHAGWSRPSYFGHVPLQAGQYLLDAYKLKIPGTPEKKGLENQAWIGRPAAAVEASYAHHTAFEDCRFEHLGSTGLDYKRGTHHNEIKGNLFKDIGGSGILVGTFSDESFETHLPYNPSDEREVCTAEHINNNLITDVTNDDWGCVGIGAGYVRAINIEHNDISNVSYTGISLGWGWTKALNVMKDNRVVANKITHYAKHMYDVAGIYTLSAQPGTAISNNYIDSIYKAEYAHDPNHWFYLYTDEGSSHITVKNNWSPSDKFLRNANGPGNVWERNGQWVSDTVKQQAGLARKFLYLLSERSIDPRHPTQPYRIDMTVERTLLKFSSGIIEIVLRDSSSHYKEMLKIFDNHGISIGGLLKWQNHFAGMSEMSDDTIKLKREVGEKLPGSTVKIYSQLIYEFDRKRCKDSAKAERTDFVWLSANLVDDPKLQQEYLNYHSKQYELWPEISQGFCNAGFQRLEIYKNGRQLMLIIRFPEGKTLDELNPKTVENNPRMVEWNQLMKKYQEGIEGTKPGEVWVQFKNIIR